MFSLTNCMQKFYTAMYVRSESKIKEQHLAKHKTDILCTNCQTWYSISAIQYNHKYEALFDIDEVDIGSITTCGKCGEVSHWNAVIAPVLIKCEKNGTPL